MSKKKKSKGLGRGLGSLLGNTPESQENQNIMASDKPAPAPRPIKSAKQKAELKKTPEQTAKVALKEEAAKKVSEPIVKTEPKVIEKIVEKVVVKEQKVPEGSRIWRIAIDKIVPNQFQPRQHFNKELVEELAASIKEHGVLQPIVVRKTDDKKFELIAGERRWRASQMAGLHDVPVIIKEVDDQDSLELALIENIQRSNLNPMEEAEAYQRLADEFQLTQEQIAKKVGKKRASVANTLRLLALSPEVRQFVVNGQVSQGHAKALLSVDDPVKQRELAKRVVSEKLSVRATEALAAQTHIGKEKVKSENVADEISNRLAKGVAFELQKLLGTKVKIDYANGKGKVQINFYSDDQFNEIADRMKDAWR
ncbi:MAG: ParB/RepB/Spo0J family partition protein [Bdellovibrionales bacterium]